MYESISFQLVSFFSVGTVIAGVGLLDLLLRRPFSRLMRRSLKVSQSRLMGTWLGCAGVLLFLTSALLAQQSTPDQQQARVFPGRESSSRPVGKAAKEEKRVIASSGAESSTQPFSAAEQDTYVIGPEDQLMISVWHEAELSMSLIVRPDGMITLPLVNDVHVVGMKPLELQSFLTERLRPYVNEPQVTVIVQGIRSRKVFLAGQVTKPGSYPLMGRMTVLELLVQAGGLGPFAKSSSIYILRGEGGKKVRIPFDYKKALSGRRDGKLDGTLQPGDMVVVP